MPAARLVLTLPLVTLLLGAATASAAEPPGKAPAGAPPPSMVVDGVPPLPERIARRTRQYHEVRGATLLDWEPAGQGLLIGTRFGDTNQVHLVSTPGGARRQLTFGQEPVGSAVFFGKNLLLRIDQGGGEFYQYFELDRQTGRQRLITDGKSRNEGLRLATAGNLYALASTRKNGRDFDIYVGDRLVKEGKGQWRVLDWSKDDRQLLLMRYVSINEAYLYLFDLVTGATREIGPSAGGKKVGYRAAVLGKGARRLAYHASDEGSEFARLVLEDLENGQREVLTPDLRWDVDHLAVSRDGRQLAYSANEGGVSVLYLGPLNARGAFNSDARGRPLARRVELPKGVISGLIFDKQSRRLGFTLSTPDSTADVYSVDVNTRKVTRWTESEVGGLPPSTFVSPELIDYRTFDGRRIPAFYYRPRPTTVNLVPGTRRPVIVFIHGGPESQSRAMFSPVIQYWVNELGAAVLVPNVRGSAGYGKSYVLLDNGIKREDSVKDIGALLDWIATRPELDPGRVAVFGGSYGGYMVLASLIHFGDRLRCGVEIVGISSFVTFLKNTQGYRRDLRRAEYGDERDPAMRRHLESISPTTHAHRIRRPLLVAQGQNDPRVPASEAEQIVRTVRKSGDVPVWYMLARDEGHGFQKKVNRDYFLNATTLFWERFLLR
jgi:dipeptidyl aminopeptidase/acylaminoacyl peptidase